MSDVSTSPRYASSGSASRPPNSSNMIGAAPMARIASAAACRSAGSSVITLEMNARLPCAHSRTASADGISAAAARSMISGSPEDASRLAIGTFYGELLEQSARAEWEYGSPNRRGPFTDRCAESDQGGDGYGVGVPTEKSVRIGAVELAGGDPMGSGRDEL